MPQEGAERRQALRHGVLALAALALIAAVLTVPFATTGAMTVNAAARYWRDLPAKLPERPAPSRSKILAADGSVIAEFYSENRFPVEYDEISRPMRQAAVAIEDNRFWRHGGVDIRGIARAFVNNALGDDTQGGSTITQQYVKNVLANAAETEEGREAASQASYQRKLREARLATAVEKQMTKEQILQGYLNISYFGDGAYGVGAAARHYFDVDASELTVPQAAMLAGVVKNPTALDPTEDPAAAQARRNTVLTVMNAQGMITDRELARFKKAPLGLKITEAPNGCTSARYPFFCQYVKEWIAKDPAFGRTAAQRAELLYRGGLTIKTSLDPKAQDIAQKAVDDALGRDNRVAAAAVTVEPGTGRVITFAVNRTFGVPKKGEFDKTQVLLPDAVAMQPGSNFKPITLAAALERGYDPNSAIYAPPVYAPADQNYPGSGFQNFGSSGSGYLDAYAGIARSSNTYALALQHDVGVLNVAAMAERLGFTGIPRSGERAITERDAALTLGVYEVSPLQLASAYATFAAHGVSCRPIAIDAVTGPRGRELEVPDANCTQAIQPSVADTVADVMQGVIDGPDPARTGSAQSIGRPAAGKTGTTQNNAAVWFSGYTPQFATAVWVGDPRGGFAYPLRNFYANGTYIAQAYGGLVAGPIWQKIMLGLHRGLPVEQFAPPSGTASGTVVPDVRGLSPADAFRALDEAGFRVRVADRRASPDDLLSPNVVQRTTPAAGTYLGPESEVSLVLTAGSRTDVRLPATERG